MVLVNTGVEGPDRNVIDIDEYEEMVFRRCAEPEVRVKRSSFVVQRILR